MEAANTEWLALVSDNSTGAAEALTRVQDAEAARRAAGAEAMTWVATHLDHLWD